jgi:hypothetical protein
VPQAYSSSHLRRAAYRIGFGVALAAVAGIGWAVWRNARGVEAIRELCASQGGLHISETAEVEGYLDVNAGSKCFGCMESLGSGRYSYVDFYDEGSQLRARQPRYQRMKIGPAGDPSCVDNRQAATRRSASPIGEYGLSSEQCFAIETLNGRPLGFVYDRRHGMLVAKNGAPIGFDELFVADERDKRVLAFSRNYTYKVPLAAWFDMSGGGGTVWANCEGTAGVPFVLSFADRVLLKKEHPSIDSGETR